MTRTSPSVDQAIYDALYTTLRRVLRTGVHAGAGTEEGLDSFLCRVVGALYALLMDHPIDRNGRCRSCRRPGSVLGRHRQDCGVYEEVSYWLGEPEKHLRERMAYQWGLNPPTDMSTTPRPASPGATGMPTPTAPGTGRRAP